MGSQDTTGPMTRDELKDLACLGRAVQVDPMKPVLKSPGTKHLKPTCYILLSTFAFKFNLRRYTWASAPTW